MDLINMDDPTYIKVQIEANPIWKFAFWMSEMDNDEAPIGWGRYIPLATWILNKYELRDKNDGQTSTRKM